MGCYGGESCEECGYKTDNTYNIPELGWYGLCADCVLEKMFEGVGDEDTEVSITDVEIATESLEVWCHS